jgi:nucleotide-binding universal stress UspA family protein
MSTVRAARPSVLCPIDFSDASRAALCYAAAIAGHFGAVLTVLAVDDPLVADAAPACGRAWLAGETARELRRFAAQTLEQSASAAMTVAFRVAEGAPAPSILRVAGDVGADLIVMSSHGRSGVRKLFFGSTTERVLRETTVPVLITPDEQEGALSLSEISRRVRRILAPVDLSPASERQVAVAAGLASALSVPLILAHVIEPMLLPASVRAVMPAVDGARRAECEARLAALAAAKAAAARTEVVIMKGDPSEEIVKLIEVRQAQLMVIGLHSSGPFGPRMGSVTYRVLCLARTLVLALPPVVVAKQHEAVANPTGIRMPVTA